MGGGWGDRAASRELVKAELEATSFSRLQIASCSPLVFSLAFEPYSGPLETCNRIHEEATEAKPKNKKRQDPKRNKEKQDLKKYTLRIKHIGFHVRQHHRLIKKTYKTCFFRGCAGIWVSCHIEASVLEYLEGGETNLTRAISYCSSGLLLAFAMSASTSISLDAKRILSAIISWRTWTSVFARLPT